jgi:CheY-like chemotaxis protein
MIEKILLIDDSEATNRLNTFQLNSAGLSNNIDSVSGCMEGITYLHQLLKRKEALPDIIFLDLKMPELDGFDFLDRLKESSSECLRKIKVIILSATINPEEFQESKKYDNVIAFYTKALDVVKLEGLIRSFFPEGSLQLNADTLARLTSKGSESLKLEFLKEVKQDSKQLITLIDRKYFNQARIVINKIVGLATSFGYYSISKKALSLEESISLKLLKEEILFCLKELDEAITSVEMD